MVGHKVGAVVSLEEGGPKFEVLKIYDMVDVNIEKNFEETEKTEK